jgi:ATP-independent RNA helicase DbpA
MPTYHALEGQMKINENTQSKGFAELPLKEVLLKNLASLGYETMTPIQAQTLPLLLQGKDVIAKAKTGSGKTVAFGLAILSHLQVENFAVQALVLCPTRELADQVSAALRQLARLMPNIKILNLSGGMPMKPQLESLRHPAHIIVGTPGRVQKHLTKNTLNLKNLTTLVLDEADRMLDLGFLDEIKAIIAACPKKRQTLLFSATYPEEINNTCQAFMRDPHTVHADTLHTELNIEQLFYKVDHDSYKLPLLKSLLLHHQPASTLIFCNTKNKTIELTDQLSKAGFSAYAINGDMEQGERNHVMIRFSHQSCSILVATDVAARGLDIKELPAVINYELAFEQEVHTHRIGRTGRAGTKGLALSLTTSADSERLSAIEAKQASPIIWGKAEDLTKKNQPVFSPEMVTLCLHAGKKDKIRPGDILGALTKEAALPADCVGKITITDFNAYVTIHQSQVNRALEHFQNGKLKGRQVNARKL